MRMAGSRRDHSTPSHRGPVGPSGRRLEETTVPQGDWHDCSRCRTEMHAGAVMFRCWLDNYDLCPECYRKEAAETSAPRGGIRPLTLHRRGCIKVKLPYPHDLRPIELELRTGETVDSLVDRVRDEARQVAIARGATTSTPFLRKIGQEFDLRWVERRRPVTDRDLSEGFRSSSCVSLEVQPAAAVQQQHDSPSSTEPSFHSQLLPRGGAMASSFRVPRAVTRANHGLEQQEQAMLAAAMAASQADEDERLARVAEKQAQADAAEKEWMQVAQAASLRMLVDEALEGTWTDWIDHTGSKQAPLHLISIRRVDDVSFRCTIQSLEKGTVEDQMLVIEDESPGKLRFVVSDEFFLLHDRVVSLLFSPMEPPMLEFDKGGGRWRRAGDKSSLPPACTQTQGLVGTQEGRDLSLHAGRAPVSGGDMHIPTQPVVQAGGLADASGELDATTAQLLHTAGSQMKLEAELQLHRSTVEAVDVPHSGACLFHAILMDSNDTRAAQNLRDRVVATVAELWASRGRRVDLRTMLGWNKLDPQVEIPLGGQVERVSGGVRIRNIDDYIDFMSQETAYGDCFEAAVAAWLEGIELTIYVPDSDDAMKLRPVATGLGRPGSEKRKILLLHHRSESGCHYNYLLDKPS